MNQYDREIWQEQLLNEIFTAIAAHPPLKTMLVFKGALVLNALLEEKNRRSLDIDSNLLDSFTKSFNDTEQQQSLIAELTEAVTDHFEYDNPVKFELEKIKIEQKTHPMGWNSFDVSFMVKDLSRPKTRGLPSISLDIAAPEALMADSIAPLKLGNETIFAYTLERTAGEKLRAFLSSLPAHRKKLERPGDPVRVKDIYDLTRILKKQPISNSEFWKKTGEEFKLACESRYIDCAGITTFEEDLATTRSSYENNPTLPKETSFDEAWSALCQIIEHMEKGKMLPFYFKLP